MNLLVLLFGRQASTGHAFTHRLEQRRQTAQHIGPLFTGCFGTGRPDQIRRSTFECTGFIAGRAGLYGTVRQHISPDAEQELTHPLMHRHGFEHLAHLDGVLNGQGLALLNLLRQRHALATGLVLVSEVALQKLFKLSQHGLEDAAPRIWVRFNHLHDPADLFVQGVFVGVITRSKTHDARAHAVDQGPSGVIDRGKKIGLTDGHTQHGHLQTRKPHPNGGGQTLFGQDALKQQGHHFNGGALYRRRCSLLQRSTALLQIVHQRSGRAGHPNRIRLGVALNHLLGRSNRMHQARTDRHRCARPHHSGRIKIRNLTSNNLVELAHGHLRLGRGARRKALRLRHQAGFFIGLPQRLQPAVTRWPRLYATRSSVGAPTAQSTSRRQGSSGPDRLNNRPNTLGATDERPQIHIRTHAVVQQQAIRFVIGLLRPLRRLGVQHILQGAPMHTCHAGRYPTVHGPAGNHLRAQHITSRFGRTGGSGCPTDGLQTRAQIRVFRSSQIRNGLRQAGHEQPTLDRAVIDQGQLTNRAPGGRAFNA